MFHVEGSVSYGVLVWLFDRVVLPRSGKVVEVATWTPYLNEHTPAPLASLLAVKNELVKQMTEFADDVTAARISK